MWFDPINRSTVLTEAEPTTLYTVNQGEYHLSSSGKAGYIRR